MWHVGEIIAPGEDECAARRNALPGCRTSYRAVTVGGNDWGGLQSDQILLQTKQWAAHTVKPKSSAAAMLGGLCCGGTAQGAPRIDGVR